MPKPGQPFKKRQRENKLREKAQLKRERRQQWQNERKASQGAEAQDGGSIESQNQSGATATDELHAENYD